MAAEMVCRVCGWWPPLVRERKGTIAPASDAWRWRRLRDHVEDVADDEMEDGNVNGPHRQLSLLIDPEPA
jgi:hypothetical protein